MSDPVTGPVDADRRRTVPGHWRRLGADPSLRFGAREIAEGRAYRRPWSGWDGSAWPHRSLLAAFVAGRAGPRLLDALPLRGWAVEVVVVALALQATSLVYAPWFAAHRALIYDKWGG